MPKTLGTYAPIVFWVGLAALALGVIVLVGGGRGPVPTEYMLIGGVVLMVLSALMRPAAVRQAFGVRGVRYGSNALVLTLGFLAILGLLDYLSTQNRFDLRKDFTANQQFTLSPQTIQILENLKTPVKATAFFRIATPRREAEDRLREYSLHSSKFTYEFFDPDERLDLVQQLGATHDGGVVFQAGNKKQEATGTSESDFTGAILKVTTDQPRAVYFVTGHRERDLNEFGEAGYGTLRQWIEKDNYGIGTLNLLITPTIPVSATVVVLASPQSALSDAETKILGDYLDQGGRLMVLSDPTKPDPLPSVLDKWGVKFDNDEVVDPVSAVQSPLLPATQQYPFSPITQNMNGLATVFPFARSVKRNDSPPNGVSTQAIVQTSPNSWGETTLDPNVQPQFDESKDIKGPVDLVVTVEGTAPISPTNPVTTTTSARKTRIVVVGTSEFVSNRILQAQQLRGFANVDLFMNSINWLAEEEALISIRPTPPDQRTLVMTGNQPQTIFLLTVIVLPALVLLTGLSVWWRRR